MLKSIIQIKMRFQVSVVLSLLASAQGKLDVKGTAKDVAQAVHSDILGSHSRKDDQMVDVLVRARNEQGKKFATSIADEVRVERDGFLYMGITIKYSQMEELEKNEHIEAVDIDHEMRALETDPSLRRRLAEDIPYGIPVVLQDIDFWNDLDAPKSPISVCVVDTGYDLGHEDLPQGGDVDGTDGAGEAWDFDGNSHGTHCAGTIAAVGSNNKGVVGVLPDNKDGNLKLLIGKAFGASGSGSTSATIAAVQGCVDQGANVISLSLGGSGDSRNARNFYADLYANQNILMIAAAGNDGNARLSYPASYPGLVSVAALQQRRNGDLSRASYSQFNAQVEIAAPGSNVLSTIPGNSYGSKSGTSMATPHVAGVAGLLWMYFPECTNAEIRHAMLFTADPITQGCDEFTGYGVVQAQDAYDLLALGDCGGDLGPSAASARGGCEELDEDGGDDDNDDTPAPTTSPTPAPTTCGGRNDSCSNGTDCCSGLCRRNAGTCR